MKNQFGTRSGQNNLLKTAELPKSSKEEFNAQRKSFHGEDDFLQLDQENDAQTTGGYTSVGLNDQEIEEEGVLRRSDLNSSLGQMQPRKDSLMGNMVERGRPTVKGSRPRGHDMGNIPNAILNDRFDHYNKPPSRPPSRDRSVDRYASRGQTPIPQEFINSKSKAPSTQRMPAAQDWTPDSGVFEEEIVNAPIVGGSRRSSRQTSVLSSELPLTGNGFIGGGLPYNVPTNQQEAESLLRQRACGQEIPPAAMQGGSFKRTESLYINPIIRRQAQIKVS